MAEAGPGAAVSAPAFRWLPADEGGRWEAFASACAAGPFAGTAWREALAAAGVETAYAVAGLNGEIVAGAIFRRHRRLGLAFLLPPPLTPYQGPWLLPRGVEEGDREARHAEEALGALARGIPLGCDRVQLAFRPDWTDARPFLWEGWASRVRYTYGLDLSKPLDPNKAVVKQVRKAREAGLKVWTSTDWPVLHQLWTASLRHQETSPCFGPDAFAACCARLRAARLLRLWLCGPSEGEAWFANAVIMDGGEAYDWVAGALRDKTQSGGNQLLKVSLCEDLARAGAAAFDLVGGDHPGIAAYKRSLGAEPRLHLEVSKDVTLLGRLAALRERR